MSCTKWVCGLHSTTYSPQAFSRPSRMSPHMGDPTTHTLASTEAAIMPMPGVEGWEDFPLIFSDLVSEDVCIISSP